TRGVRSDGHGLFLRNFFGKPNGYNDVVDFTGSQRTNPIVRCIGNVVTGGAGTETSQITIIGNIFYDCDQAATAKQGNFYTMLNNTIVHQSHVGGIDSNGAVALLSDIGTAEGLGMYLEGNIIYDAEKLAFGQTAAVITFTNNLIAQLQG